MTELNLLVARNGPDIFMLNSIKLKKKFRNIYDKFKLRHTKHPLDDGGDKVSIVDINFNQSTTDEKS